MPKHAPSPSGGSWWKTWGLRLGLLLIAAAVVLLATTSSGGQTPSVSPGADAAASQDSPKGQAGSGDPEISLPTFNSSEANSSEGSPQDAPAATEPSEPGPDKYEPFTDLPQINFALLPSQAWDTLDLISQSGPYPFSKDDSVFQNREGILPDQQRGYYREYTVITPGADNRGARRIVAGEAGELFYTDDHYSSFSEIGFS